MKIAICDDSIRDLAAISKLLEKYKELYAKTEIKVEKFTDPVKLKSKIQEKDLADIYILDIMMSEITGIDLGNQIRKAGREPVIIYITSSDDFALDAYDVHAARYLLKPIDEERFFEALDYALSYTEVRNSPIYLIKTKDGLVSVPHSQIEYIENCSRMLEVHLTNGEQIKSIFIRKSFEEEIGNLANDKSFMQVHKSFLVNMRHVKRLDGSNIIMDRGTLRKTANYRDM